jgi:hypothetical protein
MIPIVNVGYAATNYYVLGSSTTCLLIDVGWPDRILTVELHIQRQFCRVLECVYGTFTA